jgi:twinkle protein
MSMPTVLSGIGALDRSIGGFAAGELSVWTGKRGSGKSTLLGQMMLDAIDQGHNVCAYSGELSAWRFKQWTALQAAGANHVEMVTDRYTGKSFYRVTDEAMPQIDEWWRQRFFLYDNKIAAASDENSILSVFEYAVRRYGCAIFLVDNLMTARFSTSAERDFYRAQSNFTGRLVEFAKKFDVHVHLVAHPRKSQGSLEADDVFGSGDITNRADNVFSLDRLSEKDAAMQGYDSALKVLKNRSFGETPHIGLCYDAATRRYRKPGEADKHYAWEFMHQEFKEIPDAPTPFER